LASLKFLQCLDEFLLWLRGLKSFRELAAWLQANRIEKFECALLDGVWARHDAEGRRIGSAVGRFAGVAHDAREFLEQGAETMCGRAIDKGVSRGLELCLG
jgi:hypothetical protein